MLLPNVFLRFPPTEARKKPIKTTRKHLQEALISKTNSASDS